PRDPRLPHHRGAAAVERRAFRKHRVAERHRRKEIRLALDRGRAGALRQVGGRGGAAEHVGQRHQDAARQYFLAVGEFLARRQLGRDAIARQVNDLDPEGARDPRSLAGARIDRLANSRDCLARHQNVTTERIDLPSCIRSNALLMSASGIWCVIMGSISILFSMYQSTILGTSVRPRAPPNAVPRHTRPVTSWNGRVRISAPAGATPMITLSPQPL